MGLKSTCPHCGRANWPPDGTAGTERPCSFCAKPFVVRSEGGGGVPPLAGWVGVGVVVVALISLGVLPRSCGKMVPIVREHYKNDCDACDGRGTVSPSCTACRGRGYYGGARCAVCGGDGKVEAACAFCAGSGHKPTK